MRILHVIQELGVGGAERMTAALAKGARRAGHEVAVVAAPGPMGGELDVPIFTLPIVRRHVHRLPMAAHAVRRALRSWSPDIVHCHNPTMALVAALAMGWRQRRSALVTIEGAADDDYRMTARLLRCLPIAPVACGPGVAAALEDFGVHVRTIANGTSPAPPCADRSHLEREWSPLRGRKLLVAAGRLVAQKNFGLAIRALAEVPEACLVIMGEGPLRAGLDNDATEAGVRNRVVFTGLRTDARAVMGVADAVVVCSRWEGLSLVALEALAAGRPLITTKARWLDTVLTHERDCLLVDPEDPGVLAAAMRRVLGDAELAARLGRAGARVAASYTEEGAVNAYLELYATLTAP